MPRHPTALLLLAAACAAVGCRLDAPSRPAPSAPGAAVPAAAVAPAMQESNGPTVVFLGDSLTAGFGVDGDQAFPALVATALAADGVSARIVNAGVSGDTTAGGLARLDWLLRQKPDILVVELGANDGLRGQPLAAIESNLRAIVEKGRDSGARVLLVGMRIPTNYGPEYTAGFHEIYPRLAATMHVDLLPFLLEGVAAKPELNQGDGIHPNPAGHRVVAATVLATLEPMVREAAAKRAAR